MKLKLVLWILVAFCSQITYASSVITAKVTYVGTYGNGSFFVLTDHTIDEPGCISPRFDVASTHPELKNWLAIAMAAMTSGKSIMFKTAGCYQVDSTVLNPTMNTVGDTTFLLMIN